MFNLVYYVPVVFSCVLPLSETSASLIGKVSQLESMVKLLQEDLKKVSGREINWIIACKAAD